MASRLQGKIALITGGTTGIGLATAKRFLDEGAQVIVTGRNPQTLEAARRDLDGRAEVVQSDAADEGDVVQLLESIRRRHGRLDVLFLNAGIARFAPLAEASVADFDAMWGLNVRGPWLTLKHALALLPEGAAVIFNSSVAGQKGMPGTAAYSATKAALRSIVRTTAAELAPRKVRVNSLSPGPIETPIFGKIGLGPDQVDAFQKDVATRVPLGRMGAAEEIAGAAVFLASRDASYITGVDLAVDGGYAQV
jgi:NAD(P)-dependent dehydrogenase (short-subunit alcohol dehydrogenase family)